MIIKDWTIEAAEEISAVTESHYEPFIRVGEAREIIIKHCPFKPDTAYMPVPRCESCKHWDRENITSEDTAECMRKEMSARVDTSDGETIHFQMRTPSGFGCTTWEAK